MLKMSLFPFLFFFSSLHSVYAVAEHYVIGVEDLEYYPIYAKHDGEYTGFARELLDQYAESNGHTFEYKMLPVKRLYSDFIKGKLDFKFPDSNYWQADAKKGTNIVYSDPVLEYIDGVLVAPENIGKGKDHLKTLGAPRGFSPWDYMDDISNKTIALKEGNSLSNLLKMAKSKRIDGVYSNVVVIRYFLENSDFNNDLVIFDKDLPHTRANYHLSSIQHPQIIAEFNAFLSSHKAELDALKAKHKVTVDE